MFFEVMKVLFRFVSKSFRSSIIFVSCVKFVNVSMFVFKIILSVCLIVLLFVEFSLSSVFCCNVVLYL